MRILISGHLPIKHYYMPMQKLMHGLIRLGHNVAVFDDRTSARMSNMFRSRPMGKNAANQEFLKTVYDFLPELIILSHCEMIKNDTLKEAKQINPDVRIVYYNVDALTNYDKNVADVKKRSESCIDIIFSTTAGDKLRQFAGKNPEIYHLPNPVDPHIETGRSFAKEQLEYDVFFASGVKNDYNDPRWPLINAVEEKCPDVKFSIHGYHAKPFAFGYAYQEMLSKSKIGLNISRVNDNYLYSSDRISQYLGNGLLTFSLASTGFGDFYNDDEMIFFNDAEDCADKVNYYSKNDKERMKIAEKGWKKACKEYHADILSEYIIERTFSKSLSREYLWPTKAAEPLT